MQQSAVPSPCCRFGTTKGGPYPSTATGTTVTYNASTMCGEPANSTGEPCPGPGPGQLCLAVLQLESARPTASMQSSLALHSAGLKTGVLLAGRHGGGAHAVAVSCLFLQAMSTLAASTAPP